MSTIADIMSAGSLAETLFSRTRSGVFRELFASQEGVHLRELERRIGVNSRQIARELHALRDAGIVVPRRLGNLILYQFNRDSPIYQEIQSLIRKTLGLADVLRTALEPFSGRIELAYVFGSYAKGEERPQSDIDLLIVGHVSRRELSPAIRAVGATLGREISTTLYSSGEYRTALGDDNSFVHRVHAGPRIDLIVDSSREPARDAAERRDRQ